MLNPVLIPTSVLLSAVLQFAPSSLLTSAALAVTSVTFESVNVSQTTSYDVLLFFLRYCPLVPPAGIPFPTTLCHCIVVGVETRTLPSLPLGINVHSPLLK